MTLWEGEAAGDTGGATGEGNATVQSAQLPGSTSAHPRRYWPTAHELVGQEVQLPLSRSAQPTRYCPGLHAGHGVQVPPRDPLHPVLYCPFGQPGQIEQRP